MNSLNKKRTWEEIMRSELSQQVVFTTSGMRNYFGGNWFTGDGYLYHEVYKLMYPGFRFKGATHIAKTTLWGRNEGNMPWNERTLQPRSLFPDCIYIDRKKKIMLNAVGLSGPGLEDLGNRGKWQEMKKPFFISIMVMGDTPEKRLRQIQDIYWWFMNNLPDFITEVGIEINITCPNTKHSPLELAEEVSEWLKIFSGLGVHIRVKLNLEIPIETIRNIAESGFCHSLSLTNTAKFGSVPHLIDWDRLFDGKPSPLAKYGGGGLSGWPLYEPGINKLQEVCSVIPKEIPVYYGGGIEHASQIEEVKWAGASGIVLGATMGMFYPNEIQQAITKANTISWRRK
jgi:dihydroorotate dehydrogenase